ncbi:MAG: DUF6510 family protein [Solirubrobacteraceae bacterium]|jgi:hypothetical protein
MDDSDRRLDGNAAAGHLQEVFPFEMTLVHTTCSGCGAVEPLGATDDYASAPGLVLRCRHCQSVLVRMVRGADRYWCDLRGVSCIEIRVEQP